MAWTFGRSRWHPAPCMNVTESPLPLWKHSRDFAMLMSISSYNSRTANTDKCPGGFLCLPGHFASWSCIANKHVLCFRMSLVINTLQPLQECRFHGLTKCELAPVEIKDKIFTEDAPALGPWASLRSPKKMVYTKLKSSIKYHIGYYRKLIY